MAVTATFSTGTGVLDVDGDALDNTIAASRNGAGTIFVNGGAVPVQGDVPTVGNTTLIRIEGADGADTIALDETNGALPAAELTGGSGNDTLTGGSGNDTFIWNPGDGSDTVEGRTGTDTLLFTGAGASETIGINANGGRVLFTRNIGNIVMDLDDVEKINFNALGGADDIVVGDLSATDVTQVNINLEGAAAGTPDGATDTVTVDATPGDNVFGVTGGAAGVTVFGLPATVNISFVEVANDRLTLNGLGGDDVIDASALQNDGIQLRMNGGLGDDVFLGSAGGDLINGGDGNDIALMDAGDDTFVWSPGDDNDTVEGQGGADTLQFNAANVAEIVNIQANGGRVLFIRSVANVVMDLNDVERIDLNALGGADNIVVDDLSGTDVTQVNVDLAGTLGGANTDGVIDIVTSTGTGGTDTITVSSAAGVATVAGLAAQVTVAHSDATLDRLIINALGGDDTITATALAAGVIKLTILGGAGNDVLAGGLESDILDGGADDDRFIYRLGGGADEILDFVAGAGTDDRAVLTNISSVVTFADVLAFATQVNADTVIDFGNGDTLTLRNVLRASLSADDFLFESDNDAPVNTLPAAIAVEANSATAVTGLSIADSDAGAGNLTTTLTAAHGTLTASGTGVSGSGTATLTLTGTLGEINAALATVAYTGDHDYFGADALTMTTNDGGNTGNGGARSDTDAVSIAVGPLLTGTAGDNSFNAPAGNARVDGLGGVDTVMFGFKLTEATVTYAGNTVVIDGPSSHTVLTGFETFVFTDGTVDNNDGSLLIDDLFYNSKYHDVWNAHVDADFHYNVIGWQEGRDPNAFFDTSIYLTAYPDVAVGGGNPLTHFDTVGWKELRVPSLAFNTRQYLDANPDVKAAQIDPLLHFLAAGASEGRLPVEPTELITANGFDFVHYLANNPDVAAAGVDPFLHFQAIGWKEGRNPNALFDVTGYLATYTDVAAAGINPLDHFNLSGWKEGRDPSVGFDTRAYLAANPDVAAAYINPLAHFLTNGVHEGRSPEADGVFG